MTVLSGEMFVSLYCAIISSQVQYCNINNKINIIKADVNLLVILQIVLVASSCLCHLYVYSVAHTHTKNISKTLQSHHASMQRLNSICGAKSPSQTNQRDTMMVYNGAGAGIDTCLLYTGRPSGPSSSATNLQTTQTLTVVTPRQQISLLTPPPVSLTLTPTPPPALS